MSWHLDWIVERWGQRVCCYVQRVFHAHAAVLLAYVHTHALMLLQSGLGDTFAAEQPDGSILAVIALTWH